ncbi:MAG: hypothetical protein AAGH19_10735 [Pseudomonadota bacterium]
MTLKLRATLASLILALFTAPLAGAHHAEGHGDNEEAIEAAAAKENLEPVEDGPFTETWVNPDVDFTQFNKLMLGSAVFDYRDVPETRRYRSPRHRSNQSVFSISEEDRKEFETIVGEAFREEIARGENFTITEQADEQTILVRGAVADIISRVPPMNGMNDTYLSSVGEATLALEFLNPLTGEVMAVVAERGLISSTRGQIAEFGAQRTTPGRIRSEVRNWSKSAARTLRDALDEAMGG